MATVLFSLALFNWRCRQKIVPLCFIKKISFSSIFLAEKFKIDGSYCRLPEVTKTAIIRRPRESFAKVS
jgi:hypothetical protein